MSLDHTTYLSPYSWRYGSPAMRALWSEVHKRRTWRKLWVTLAEVQAEFGLVTPTQVDDLRAHADQIDIARATEIEKDIQHDVMAEVKTFAEQCPIGGGIIHLGMTSMDIVDNTDALRVRESLDLLLARVRTLLDQFATLIDTWAATPIMAFTHLQPAEPSTLGYRFAQTAQDLLTDYENLTRLRATVKGKGLKGAVGTSASYTELFGKAHLAKFETRVSERLNLPFFPVTTQVYPRKQDYDIVSAVAGLGATLYKFAFDLRLLQSPPLGELSEPFGKKQIGSSAMPFKRNPIHAEKIDSLARMLAQYPRLAWDNAAHTLLERTLDDSANRRTSLPETFLIADELLLTTLKITKDLRINEPAIHRNMSIYGPFAATEKVLMALGKAGADRQNMHERIRVHAMNAWGKVQMGEPNPLVELIAHDEKMLSYLSESELRELMDASDHVGDAPERARQLSQTIRNHLAPS
jgi:adenylosuccinate lyase